MLCVAAQEAASNSSNNKQLLIHAPTPPTRGRIPPPPMTPRHHLLSGAGSGGSGSGSEMMNTSAGMNRSSYGGGGLDSQLWHACAGGMVQLPPVGARVIYFPQGHAEQAAGVPDLRAGAAAGLGPAGTIPCRLVSVDFLADTETDEVFAKLRLQPEAFSPYEADLEPPPAAATAATAAAGDSSRPASFAKTLTQSDANNGGGFSVPRYCAETIFPRLDYSVDPPVQTVLARDVHGEVWKFRHIYRGTPRRHLLTTGWSTFVNQKKLVAGDAIVFLRSAAGELCVGVRRSMRGPAGGAANNAGGAAAASNSSRWASPDSGAAFATSDRPAGPTGGGGSSSSSFARNRARVSATSVSEAATLAAAGRAFEVVYYPRASTAEFCVRAGVVRASLEHGWYPGMRFKMAFETEDSSRISWFMGTIAAVQPAEPVRWPSSPWRILQVTWDEPELLQGVNRVSPWQVELVSTLPMQLPPFSLPRKKFRASQPPENQFGGGVAAADGQGGFVGLPTTTLAGNLLGQLYPWQSLSEEIPAGMQGARHERFYGLTFSEFQPKQRFAPAGLSLDGIYPPLLQQQHHHHQQQHLQVGGGRGGTMDLKLNTNGYPTFDYFRAQQQQQQQQQHNNGNSSSSSSFRSTPAALYGSSNGVTASTSSEVTAPAVEAQAAGAGQKPSRKRSATIILFGKAIHPDEVDEPAADKESLPSSNSSFGENGVLPPDDARKQEQQQQQTMLFSGSCSGGSVDLRLCQGESPESGVTNESGSSKWLKEQPALFRCDDKDDKSNGDDDGTNNVDSIINNNNTESNQGSNSGSRKSDKGVVHCKIFLENEEVGRTLDLSHFGTYDEVYDKLAIMFTVDKSKLSGRVVYKDLEGSTIYMGGEPYRNFMNSVKRLTILAFPSSSTGSRSAQSW